MADTKISALAAVASVVGAQEFAVNDAGTTKKATATQIAAFTTPAASDTVAGKIEVADQTEQEAGTDITRAVSPGRQHFHPSASKCWGFTTGGGTPVLNAVAYNMTSITDTNVGRLTVTIGTDFSSANYCVVFGGTTTNSTTASRIVNVNTKAAGSFEIDSYSAVTPTLADIVLGFDWACFGDL